MILVSVVNVREHEKIKKNIGKDILTRLFGCLIESALFLFDIDKIIDKSTEGLAKYFRHGCMCFERENK